MSLIQLAEKRWLPDPVIRYGMRRMLRDRLEQEKTLAGGKFDEALDRFADRQRQSVVTIETHRANEQHYEVPAKFFELVLGSRLKYSCGLWEDPADGVASHGASANDLLDESEEAMLRLTCQRAGIENGMRVLELGCGWGSLSLWIAEQFPDCQITSLSNSSSQKRFIEEKCRQRGFQNVNVITADVGAFDISQVFDRVVSVEMFEHVRNHEELLSRIARWLVPDGRLFVHIFCHRNLAYTFETEGEENWMGRHFFSGGIMPAEDLFLRYQKDLTVQSKWWISGLHYAKTCEAWLSRLDNQVAAVKQALTNSNADEASDIVVQRWRMFFMACAELFKYEDGNQWGVGHYSFTREGQARSIIMSTIQVLLMNMGVISIAMVTLWMISLRLKDASIVDIFWGLGFVLVAWATFAVTPGGIRPVLLVTMTTIWGIRLAAYLAWRNHGKGEDARYRAMRDYRGESFWWFSLLSVFGLQGAVMWIVSLPVQVGLASDSPLTLFNCVGVAIWLIGLFFEAIGDYQLAKFKLDPSTKGQVMDRGLWRYTRHPNYFGNALIWWGIFMVSASISDLWLIVSPILMTFLLVKVSGVALLERSLASRSSEYQDYIRRTSSFIPWFPRSN